MITDAKAIVIANPSAAPALRTGLEAAGCREVRELSTCTEALAVLDEPGPGPDLILLSVGDDWQRQVSDCRRIAHQFAAVPLIIIADNFDPDLEPAMLAAGATDFLARPYGIREVMVRAAVAFRLRSERQRAALRELRLVTETTRLERKSEELSKLVSVDPLTGLINRRHGLTLLDAEWRRAARAGTSIAVVIADVDHFHQYNERNGHLGGDVCLRQLAIAMAVCLRRPTDFLARFGGEEFLAVLASTDAAGVALVAERFRAAVEALAIPRFAPSDGSVVTISVGFAARTSSDADRDANQLLARADAALFRAKAGGRNRVDGDAAVVAPAPAAGADARYPVVTVDPSLVDYIPAFLAEVRAETHLLADAVARSDFATIRILGHRLEATARETGLDEFAALGTRLDVSARDADIATIRTTIEDLASYADRVQVVYRRSEDA